MKEKIAVERGYFVTEDGFAFNKHGVKIGSVGHDGYHRITIKINGSKKNIMVHRIQAFQKYGDLIYENEIQVRHIDGDKNNNSHENIVIGTSSENQLDIPKQVRIKRALYATSFVRKYDREKVIKFFEECKSYKKTMEEFSISSKGTLHFILKGGK